MPDLTVYRSAHPAVLAARDRHNRAITQWRRDATQLITDIGYPGRQWIVGTAFGDRWLIGITPHNGIELPLRGWRRTRADGRPVFVPDRRTRGGKHIATRMRDCKPPAEPHIDLPGMPSEVEDHEHNRIHTPGMQEMDGVIWVTWSIQPPETTTPGPVGHVRLDLWEQARLSTYYAARERQQAALQEPTHA